MTPPIPPTQRTIGPIKLVPGATPAQVGLFLVVVLVGLTVVTFLPMMQSLVFNEILHLPRTAQGRLAGNLVTVQQTAVLVFISVAGSMADRFGRKRVLLTAITGYVAVMVLYPLAANVATLFLLQFVFGALSTAHIAGASSLIADYPDNVSRGKFVALVVLVQAAVTAVLVGWLGARLPAWLVTSGDSAAIAGRNVFWMLAGLAAFTVAVAAVWMRNPPLAVARVARPRVSVAESLRTFWRNARAVIAYGRSHPRFGLVMTMGIVIRSDYFVMLSFVSLWVINASAASGMSQVEALKIAGLLLLTFKLSVAASQLTFGFVTDLVDRPRLLIVALLATGLSLVATCLIHDVGGLGMYVVVAAIGFTESALIVCGQTMLGEESPVALRGSALGLFYFAGTLGVIVMSSIAGFLFDKIGYSAPFVMVGLLNLLFGLLGAALILRRRGSDATKTGLHHAA